MKKYGFIALAMIGFTLSLVAAQEQASPTEERFGPGWPVNSHRGRPMTLPMGRYRGCRTASPTCMVPGWEAGPIRTSRRKGG